MKPPNVNLTAFSSLVMFMRTPLLTLPKPCLPKNSNDHFYSIVPYKRSLQCAICCDGVGHSEYKPSTHL